MGRDGSTDGVRGMRAEGAGWMGLALPPALRALLLALVALGMPLDARAAGSFGGSLDLTSDYFVRGISRSDDQAALQLDLHYVSSAGLIAGFFASNTKIDPGSSRGVELDPFLGYVTALGADWQLKLIAESYLYPWNEAGTTYNYDELDVDLGFRGWLDLRFSYSPDSPRYFYDTGYRHVAASSVELNMQHRLCGRLSGNLGAGYYRIEGPAATDYGYWSAGFAYDLAPVWLALTVVGTTPVASTLYYNAAGGGHVAGTILWRF